MEDNRHLSIHIPETDKPRVLIIGGGFAGIQLVRKLSSDDFQVIMIDRHNYHTFQPLLYQVATAGLEPDSIAGPLRKVLGKRDFHFRMTTVERINHEENTVTTKDGELRYDYLVIATGSKTNYFGNTPAARHAFPLKQVPQALDLRSHILQNFETAEITNSQEDINSLMNFVIVGGGPTGVEVAGALGELRNHVLPQDYPELNFKKMNIYLVEGQDRLLGGMSDKSADRALKYLRRFGVHVYLNTLVKSCSDTEVELSDGRVLPTRTIVWAAGVKGNLIEGLPQEVMHRNRIHVDEVNRVKGFENIYAIGDVAHMVTEASPNGLPMLAPVAMQQGRHLGKNLSRQLRGKALKPFSYTDKGSMATVGRNRAVVDMPNGMRWGGTFAWYIWMFIHLLYLIGFRSKLVVLSNWIINYFTYDRNIRLIIRPFVPKQKLAESQE